MNFDLSPIETYKMTDKQALAYKLCLMWDLICEHEAPGYRHERTKRNGDPRKCMIFKYMFKLVNETQGIIPQEDYKFYITAQVQMLRNLGQDVCPLIGPQCLVGNKAWIRWKIWKKKYDAIIKRKPENTDVQPAVSMTQVRAELDKTRFFLCSLYDGPPNYEQIERAIKECLIVKWINLSKISPYYLLLSPYVQKATNNKLQHVFKYDFTMYEKAINDEVRLYFVKTFANEFEAIP